jgi:hypothetical protein
MAAGATARARADHGSSAPDLGKKGKKEIKNKNNRVQLGRKRTFL